MNSGQMNSVKIRSIHGEEVSNFWVVSLITWCNPNWDVKFSITSPSEVVFYSQNQLFDLALKSPISTTKNGFLSN